MEYWGAESLEHPVWRQRRRQRCGWPSLGTITESFVGYAKELRFDPEGNVEPGEGSR
jgi:hypothetical protein